MHVKRLQHLDDLVDYQVALPPQEVHGVLGVRKVDRRSVRDESVRGQVITQAEIDAEGVECAPDLLQRRLLAQPYARP